MWFFSGLRHFESARLRISLPLVKCHNRNFLWGSGLELHTFLTAVLDGSGGRHQTPATSALGKEALVLVKEEVIWGPGVVRMLLR